MKNPHIFPTAEEALKQSSHQASLQARSPSFKLAFSDQTFLLRDELRPIRLQLELLKPELLQQEQNVESTVVVFGSARTPSPEQAQQRLADAQQALEDNPDDPQLTLALRRAEKAMEHSQYYDEARLFAQRVSNANLQSGRSQLVITTGGGPGIMEAANRGAHDVGSKSIGLAIVLPKEELPNPYVTPELCFQFHYFAVRKMHFLMRACAMVAFPGGFGTLDELFETLTLMQTGRIKKVPIILFGQKFWDRIINFDALVDEGVISENDLDLFRFVESAQQAWEIIAEFYQIAEVDFQ